MCLQHNVRQSSHIKSDGKPVKSRPKSLSVPRDLTALGDPKVHGAEIPSPILCVSHLNKYL